MARLREFDPEDALNRAMELFWKQGFGATSIDDLVQATGVSRHGLYGTFGNKRELFEAAFERYAASSEYRLEPLRAKGASLPAIHDYFRRLAEMASDPQHRLGCFIVNTATELGAADERAAQTVRHFLDELRRLLRRALVLAGKLGETRKGLDAQAAADHLLAVQLGLATMLRTGVELPVLRRAMKSALNSLE